MFYIRFTFLVLTGFLFEVLCIYIYIDSHRFRRPKLQFCTRSQLSLKKSRHMGTRYFLHQYLSTYNKHSKEGAIYIYIYSIWHLQLKRLYPRQCLKPSLTTTTQPANVATSPPNTKDPTNNATY